MKILSIGRDDNCNIILSDNMISRHHAILKIHATGKMEIISMGQNGTFVNGIKLKLDTIYPITRKDIVSFAHVRQLDWSQIPDIRGYYRYGIIGVFFVVLLIVCIVAFSWFVKDDNPVSPIVVEPQMNEVEVSISEKQEQITTKEETGKTEKDSSSNKEKRTRIPPDFFPDKKSKNKKAEDKKDRSQKEESDSKSEQSIPIM